MSIPGQPDNCKPVADERGFGEHGSDEHGADTPCAASAPGPLDDLSALQRELRALVHDQLRLAGLELRLAAHSVMTMISAAVCMGALLVVAWLGLMGAAGLGLMEMGLEPALVSLVLAAVTLVLAGLLRLLIRHRSRDLGLPASLRALRPPAAGNRNGKAT